MTQLSKRTLFWAPRALASAYIVFLSLFALDVFSEGRGLWGTVVALAIHLVPALVLVVGLVLAWRWEWIGATFYGAAGVVYIIWAWQRPLAPAIKIEWTLTIALPALVVAALFLANWLKHAELHSSHP